MVLLSSNSGSMTENNTCHNDVTCPLWSHPELTQTVEPGLGLGLTWVDIYAVIGSPINTVPVFPAGAENDYEYNIY